MLPEKQDILKRINSIKGHLNGIGKMIEEDKYCLDVLRQTYAVRKSIAKLEAIPLENHLSPCIHEGITSRREEALMAE
jgi:DNA-binding FrmR family transcriptional regulator